MKSIIKLRQYCKDFKSDESGMEFLQFAIIVVVTVGLFAVIMGLKTVIENNIQKASDEANSQMGGLLGGGGGGD